MAPVPASPIHNGCTIVSGARKLPDPGESMPRPEIANRLKPASTIAKSPIGNMSAIPKAPELSHSIIQPKAPASARYPNHHQVRNRKTAKAAAMTIARYGKNVQAFGSPACTSAGTA